MNKRYQQCVERLKEYLETIKDFDELVFPQSLFHHFLGPEPSTKVWKDLEVLKKSECFFFFCLLLIFFFFDIFFVLLGMTTRFSKKKLAEAQEKKAKGGIISGLMSKKKTGEVVKQEPSKRLLLPSVLPLPLCYSR